MGGEGRGEGGGARGRAVEDYERVAEVAFFDEVFAHALEGGLVWGEGNAGGGGAAYSAHVA